MFFNLKLIVVIYIFSVLLFNTLKIDAQFRIVNGVDVGDDENIPYQISLQILTDYGKYKHYCSGSILSPTRILTAAHCVKGYDPMEMSVVAGIRDVNATGQRSQVRSYDIHPNYKELVTGDVGIIYIDPPLKLDGETVTKIDINSQDIIGAGATVIITGWGSVNPELPVYPIRMQKLIYKTIKNEECKPLMTNLTNAELCARGKEEGSCVGDSGGPLVMRKGNRLLQVGVVSYGSTVCANETPDVYTRASAFADWIKRKL